MTIFAGKSWTEILINRWRAKATLGALLRRADDHFLDDIGVEREDLRRAFGQWQDEARDRWGGRLWRFRAPFPAAIVRSSGSLALPTTFARSRTHRPSHGRSACTAR